MKNTFYFPHDYHARHDPKLERLRMEVGPVSDGIFWDLVEMLYEQNGYLPIKDIPLYAKMLNTDEQLLNKVINTVFVISGDMFFNQSLLDRLSHIQNVREERRAAGKLSGESRQRNICSTNDEHLRNNIKESKVKESKEKEREYIKLSHAPAVLLFEDEHEYLLKTYGQKITNDYVNRLNDYSGIDLERFKKYTSHFSVIKTWLRKDGVNKLPLQPVLDKTSVRYDPAVAALVSQTAKELNK
jgi:hypothetical protein